MPLQTKWPKPRLTKLQKAILTAVRNGVSITWTKRRSTDALMRRGLIEFSPWGAKHAWRLTAHGLTVIGE